ncbi:hypothetical protein CEV33_4563, partial [Brucella grignonensis]
MRNPADGDQPPLNGASSAAAPMPVLIALPFN